jgi:SOS-response transcriptional repressor LexA
MIRHSGEIVKAALEAKNMTQTDLAKKIGKNQTLISRYILGQIEISDKVARALAEILEIDLEELLHQLQKDRLERRVENLKAEFKEVYSVSSVQIVSDIDTVQLVDSIPDDIDEFLKEESKGYPLLPVSGIDAENSFALKVSKKSLTDDKVDSGDVIVIDTRTRIIDGDRVIAILDGRPMLRKIYHKGKNTIFQSPENHEEPVIVVSQKDEFKVLGKVVLCIKYFLSA